MSAQQPRRLLTTQAAADALGIGRTTIFALLKSGELDSVAIGRRRFVSAEQIDYYVRSRS